MLSKATFSLAAGGAAVAFVGYCIYFDRKRRNDPNYKEKVKEKRRKAKEHANSANVRNADIPDVRDQEAMQKFFLSEVQLGEELLGQGQINESVEHLSNAVAVCGNPGELLKVLQQTIPPQVFQLLISRIPQANMRIAANQARLSPQKMATTPGAEGEGKSMLEDEMD